MKKTVFSGILVALATVILCMCLTACSTNVAGTYKFYSMTVKGAGIQMDLKVGDKFMDVITLTEDYMVITLNDDNTATMKVAGATTASGTWEKDGGKYYLVIAGEKQEFKVSGNKLTIKEDGNEVVLKK